VVEREAAKASDNLLLSSSLSMPGFGGGGEREREKVESTSVGGGEQ
jgi:hypothetical protein